MRNLLQFLLKKRFNTQTPKALFAISFLSILIINSANTLAADITTAGNGNWNSTTNNAPWPGGVIPSTGDNVTIAAGHTINVDVNTASLASLTVNGTLVIGNNNSDRTVTVNGSVTVTSTGAISVSSGNATHPFLIGGNLVNDGIFDMIFDGNSNCSVTFNGSANQTVSGTGSTTDFNDITINNSGAANNNIVEIISSNFTVPADFLTLTGGILKVSGSFTLSNAFFAANSYTINSDEGLWLNNPNVTVTGQGGTVTLSGSIRITAGTYNVGTNGGNSLTYATGSSFTMEGGIMNIAGRFCGTNSAQTITFNIGGGTLTVMTVGSSNALASFDISAAGSSFTMSDGIIVIQEANAAAGGDYRNVASTLSITGGTIQFGNASTPASDDDFDIGISGTNALPNLSIVDNASSTPVVTLVSPIAASGNITINTGTTLAVGAQAIAVTGNWTNNGTFTAGTGTVTFNGNAVQTISTTTTFNNLTIDNSAGVTLLSDETVNGTLTLTDGNVNTTLNLLTIAASGSISGGSSSTFVSGPLAREKNTAAQQTLLYPIGKGGAYRPIELIPTHTDATLSTYTAEVFNSAPTDRNLPSTLDNVSTVRYWNVTKTGSATVTSAFIVLNYGTDDGVTDPDDDDLSVAKADNGNWIDLDGIANGVPVGSILSEQFTTFSDFVLGNADGGSNPLPVELSSFTASLKGKNVILNWETKTEVQNYGFEIERCQMANGKSQTEWGNIGFVKGHGNSNSTKKYSFVDNKLTFGKYFYRLKQIDTDGGFEYSKVVEVDFRTTDNFSLEQNYPNPFNPVTTIKFAFDKNTKAQLKVYDVLGSEVANLFNENTEAGKIYEINFDASGLSSGVYYYQLSGDNKTEIKKMLLLK